MNQDPSIAQGQPNGGWLVNGINLKDRGDGYYHDTGDDAIDTDDWGTGSLLYIFEAAAYNLKNEPSKFMGPDYEYTPSDFRGDFGVLDLSLKDGGVFKPHKSHQNGLDVDLRYIRLDRVQGALNIKDDPGAFDNFATAKVMFEIAQAAEEIGYIDEIFCDKGRLGFDLFAGGESVLNDEPDHSNHFHVRIKNPTLY